MDNKESNSDPTAYLVDLVSNRKIPVTNPRCRVGRDDLNDIVISGDQSISRFHFIISFENNQYLVQDAKSRHGTFLNGNQIGEPEPINDGDVLKIGVSLFWFVIEAVSQESTQEPTQPVAVEEKNKDKEKTKAEAEAQLSSTQEIDITKAEEVAKLVAQDAAKEAEAKAESTSLGQLLEPVKSSASDSSDLLSKELIQDALDKGDLSKAEAEAEAKAKEEEEEKAKAEAEAKAKEEEEEKAKAEAEAKAKEEEEEKAKAEAEAKAKEEEEEKTKAEAEAKAKEEEEEKAKAEAEAKAKEEEEKAEAKAKEEEEEKAKAEAEAKAKEEEEKAEAEARAKEEEEKAEAEARAKEEEEKAEAEARAKEEEEKAEAEARAKEEEDEKAKAEAEDKKEEENEKAESHSSESETLDKLAEVIDDSSSKAEDTDADADSSKSPAASDDNGKESTTVEPMSTTKIPDWCKRYFSGELKNLNEELEELNEKIRNTQERIKEIEGQTALTKGLRNTLLTREGDTLIDACKKVLTLIGWKVTQSEEDKQELLLESDDDEKVAIARIIWTDSTAERSHLGQLSISLTRYWCEKGVEPKGVLLVAKITGDEPTDPSDSTDEELVEYAGKKNVCFLSTLQLLAIYREVSLKSNDSDEVRKEILESQGWLPDYKIEPGDEILDEDEEQPQGQALNSLLSSA